MANSAQGVRPWIAVLLALACLFGTAGYARDKAPALQRKQNPGQAEGSSSEARLLEVYKLMAQGNPRQALDLAEKLVIDVPNFQLAQLVYGDLLAARTRTLKSMGDVPPASANAGAVALSELKEESQRRVLAAKERPSGAPYQVNF